MSAGYPKSQRLRNEDNYTMEKENKILTMGFIWKNAVMEAIRVIVYAFSLICLVFAIIVCAFPSAGAKLTNTLGMTNVEKYCYNKIYENSGKATDLYNLVLFEQSVGDVAGEFAHIESLTKRSDYQEFCQKLDEASLKNCKDKKLIVYIYSVDIFLSNQKIKCIYELDIDGAEREIKQALSNENLLNNSISTYVSLVVDGNLSDAQKIAKLNLLANSEGLMNLLEERTSNLQKKYYLSKKKMLSKDTITIKI